MTQETNAVIRPLHPISLGKLMLIGAIIGLAAISIFVFGVDHPNPEWGSNWRIRPLVVTPVAGAMGGLVFYLMDHLRFQGGWLKVLANVLSVLIWIVGLWMGIVLGLGGTMWD